MNRLQEGLRVLEDIARFELNDKYITAELREMRQMSNSIRKAFSLYIVSRESARDMGRESSFDRTSRRSINDIAGSSFGRIEESLRVIEEFSKIAHKESIAIAKSMRFKAYTLEKTYMKKLIKIFPVFPDKFGLYLVITSPATGYENITEAAVKSKVRVIQLRDKKMHDKELLKTARNMHRITKGSSTLLIINDRPDIAVLSDADGVHLGQDDMTVEEARKIMCTGIVGKSTHNIKQAEKALGENPDYIGIGPVFSTMSKAIPDPVLGCKKAGIMLKKADVPAVAIGGIKDHNLKQVLDVGFVNFGIVTYVTDSINPQREMRKIMKLFRSYNDTEK